MNPALVDGRVRNNPCGCPPHGCGCTHECGQTLDPWINEVIEVRVDGAVVAPGLYEVRSNRVLVRLDGTCWPVCQDMTAPDGVPGTWSVTYYTGYDVPAGGRRAAALLAVEIEQACQPGGAGVLCGPLSEWVTSIDLDGVSYQIDTLAAIQAGSTGIPAVDSWIRQVNPTGALAPMQVYSPDTVRGVTTTWRPPPLDPPAPPGGGW